MKNFRGGPAVKNQSAMQKTRFRSPGQELPLEKEMAAHASILAWRTHGQRSLEGHSLAKNQNLT